jgi:geranylgeranyl diphosphate synthase type I
VSAQRTSYDGLRTRVDAALRTFLRGATAPLRDIAPDLAPFGEAIETFVLDGGKRLRPAFCYWGHRAAGGVDSDAIVAASASLELLQACALVHDDVIDASDTRRGKPSVHRGFATIHREAGWRGDPDAFGAAAAILLGDLALIWADTMLAESGVGARDLQRALSTWDAMRVEVMCGQYLDVVEQARGGGSVERALTVARYKSAKYTVERPLQLGAQLAGAGDDVLRTLSAYGLPLGEAFQLRDDLLGVFGDPTETGKPAGDDLREGKRTVLVAFATEAATPPQRDALDELIGDAALDDTGVHTAQEVLVDTGAVAAVERLIVERLDAARAALTSSALDPSAAAALEELAEAATRRTR